MSKTILTKVNGWTPMIDAIVEQYGCITAVVFGVIWRHCQMKDNVCRASKETLAKMTGLSKRTIILHANKLVEDGFLSVYENKGEPSTYRDTGKAGLQINICGYAGDARGGVQEMHTSKTLLRDKEETLGASAKSEGNPSPDLLDGMIKYQTKGDDLSWCPEPLQDLAGSFMREANRIPARKERKSWIAGLYEMANSGVSPENIQEAVRKMRENELLIYDPHSVKKVAISIRAAQGAKNKVREDMDSEKAKNDAYLASLTEH